MADQMTHWERIRATLKGEEVDRVAVSMWRHFYAKETSARSLAEAMLSFQKKFDWDFVKVNPRASYHAEGWGVEVKYTGDRSPDVTKTPVSRPDDWLKIEPLNLNRGVLKEQLDAVELIARDLKGSVPFVMTVFNPISVAARLAPSEQLFLEHLREHTDKVRHALEVVTETFIDFSRACLNRGASGLFFATTAWATSETMPEEDYRRFARPYDLKLLEALSAAEFNILHVCRYHNFLSFLADYPVEAVNWDARGTGNPSLAEGKAVLGGKAVIGGISNLDDLVAATPQQLTGEVIGLRTAMGNRGWMLGTGCTFLPETPETNLTAIRQAVDKVLTTQ
ncbi:MAG: uroporphyrinogen decarboxylase family protein [Chloroflexi bacterium]|nr:uroporphyrinogen decarboxylase family protein [Chloroflexota bacterium]